jgi:FMN phosphatase YigB (HAD superfamily)
VTHQFFQWVIRSSLVRILDSYGLSTVVLEGSTTFDLLVSAWGKLQPRPGATEVLAKLSKKYQLGLFSNGDKSTLQAALRIFPSSVNISLILSSDYPVHCFEPCPAIYAQALDAVNSD